MRAILHITGMAVVASALALMWFLSAFLLRIAIHVHRYRDTGVRGNAGPPGSLGWWVRLLFTAATVVVAVAPVLAALEVVAVVDALDHAAGRWVGLVLTVAGIGLTFGAQLTMGRSWRIGVDPGERTELVVDGMFAVVRNPIFSAMVLTAVGLAAMVPTVPGLVGALALVVVLQAQVRGVEEPYLRGAHGRAYDSYVAGTGRFVPRLMRR